MNSMFVLFLHTKNLNKYFVINALRDLRALVLLIVCLQACDKQYTISVIERSEIETKVLSFLGHSDDNLAFIFFTDPHLLGSNDRFPESVKSKLDASFIEMKELYHKLPISFCLSGGDWLNQGDTQAIAKEKLLYADKKMKKLFPNYHKMMGNHDTNYQGVVSRDNSTRGDFPREWIDEVYFSETGSAYYAFEYHNTVFFILDSDLDWDVSMDGYKWKQIKWLAGQLAECNNKHIIIGIHMFYRSGKSIPMSEELVKLCDSYNHNTTYSALGEEFNYSNSLGTIHAIVSGHKHSDSLSFVGCKNDLPAIQTCSFSMNSSPTFDISVLDYNSGYLEMIRIGKGEDRRIKMAM